MGNQPTYSDSTETLLKKILIVLGDGGGGGGSGTNALTTEGDMLYRGATADERLPIGDNNEVLSVSGGVPVWRAEASYIDAVINDPTELPITVGTPPINSVYLSLGASGVWLINRKPAGLYNRVADNGVAADWVYLGAFPEVNSSANWELYDGTDPTKELKFDLSGITTATTRTLTVPNASGRIQVEGQPIGNTTPAAGSFSTLNIPDGTKTSLPFFFANNTDLGFYRRGNNTITFVSQGQNRMEITGNQLKLEVNQSLNWVFNDLTGSPDLSLFRDAGDTLAQRRGTAAQTFNIYNTFTSATNHERGFLKWSSNVFQIGTEKGSAGGTARDLVFQTDGVTRLTLGAAGDITANGFVIDATSITPTSGNRNYETANGNGLVGVTSGAALAAGTNAPRFAAFSNNRCGMRVEGEFGWASSGAPSSSNFDLILLRDAADTLAQRRGTTAQSHRLYNTWTNTTDFERLNFRWASNELIIDAEAGGTGTLRGIKLGSASTSLLGFFGATPVVQQAAVADATDAASTQARLNDLLARVRTLGLIAT